MTHFIARRLLQSLFLLLGVTAMSFTVQRLAPGGPAQFNEDPRLPREYADQLRRQFGLDQPIYVQYVKWLGNAARGNFGRSFTDRRPVTEKILERAPATMLLSGAGILVGMLGIPLGILAAVRRDGVFDHTLRFVSVILNSMPNWWLGLVILLISVNTVNWFPLTGMYSPGDGSLTDRLRHLLLPAIVAGTDGWLVFSRFMRSEFLEVAGQDYIRTARAKGLAERTVLYRHALRNALIVVITVLGGTLAALLSGAVLLEFVFSWPGMGRLALESALQRDYPVLMGLVVMGAVLIILGNLIADILYGFVNPRIRYT